MVEVRPAAAAVQARAHNADAARRRARRAALSNSSRAITGGAWHCGQALGYPAPIVMTRTRPRESQGTRAKARYNLLQPQECGRPRLPQVPDKRRNRGPSFDDAMIVPAGQRRARNPRPTERRRECLRRAHSGADRRRRPGLGQPWRRQAECRVEPEDGTHAPRSNWAHRDVARRAADLCDALRRFAFRRTSASSERGARAVTVSEPDVGGGPVRVTEPAVVETGGARPRGVLGQGRRGV